MALATGLHHYRVGDKSADGHTISRILGQSEYAVVFEDDKKSLHWETAQEPMVPGQTAAQQEFLRLHARAIACMGRRKRNEARRELAQALFRGLNEALEEKALAHFEHAEKRIAYAAVNASRVEYVLFSTVSAILIAAAYGAVVWLGGPGDLLQGAAGAAAGAVGAWASVLQRSSTLQIGPFESPLCLAFQGTTRTVFGAICGVAAVWLVKSGLVLSIAVGNPFAMTAISFVSGFSERYVPELVSEVAAQR